MSQRFSPFDTTIITKGTTQPSFDCSAMNPLEPDETPMGIAECLVNATRVVSRLGIAYTDDETNISEDLAVIITQKASYFQMDKGELASPFVT